MVSDASKMPSRRPKHGLLASQDAPRTAPGSLPVASLSLPEPPWSLLDSRRASQNLPEPPRSLPGASPGPPWSLRGASLEPPGASLELPKREVFNTFYQLI